MHKVILAGAILCAAILGALIGRHFRPPPLLPPEVIRVDFQQTPTAIPCPATALVLLIAGQSNASNHGETKAVAPANIVNFYDGKCYRARDPLLGGSGPGGSIWTRLSLKGPVIVAPIAIGSSQLTQWTPGGDLWPRIAFTIRQMQDAGLKPSLFLWLQGETESMFAGDAAGYQKSLVSLLRAVPLPAMVARETRCKRAISPAIWKAQREGALAAGAIVGPDMDAIGKEYRIDACHLNDAGLKMAGRIWTQAIEMAISPANSTLRNVQRHAQTPRETGI